MHKVRIYVVNTDMEMERIRSCEEKMLPSYIKKFHERTNQVSAYHALASAYLLYAVLGISCDDEIGVTEYGKPFLIKDSLYFSISHDRAYSVIAVSDMELGVDLEAVQKMSAAVVKRVYPQRFKEILEQTPDEKKDDVYIEMWTQVEAMIKAGGAGFYQEPREHPQVLEGWEVQTISFHDMKLSVAMREPFTMEFCDINNCLDS